MTKDDLQEALRKHAAWLREESDGERADLRRANLRGAVLRDANLLDTNLVGANLRDASLVDTNLLGADLRRANLRRADLRDARKPHHNLPDGSLIGRKKCQGFLVKLRIPERARRVMPLASRKCRAEMAEVLWIDNGKQRVVSEGGRRLRGWVRDLARQLRR